MGSFKEHGIRIAIDVRYHVQFNVFLLSESNKSRGEVPSPTVLATQEVEKWRTT